MLFQKELINITPFLLSTFYGGLIGLAIFIHSELDLKVIAIAAMLGCCLGLIFRRPWAVVGIAVAGFFCAGTGIFEVFRAEINLDPVLLGFIIISLWAAVFFCTPFARQIYLSSSPGIPARTILLVDDDKSLLKLLQTNFKKEGYFVLTAENGEKGLSLAQQHHPDLILLDVILPGMKGRNVCARLKEDSRTKDIPVIFLTAKDSPDDVQAELALGAVTHITKPIDYRKLSAEVKKHL